MAKIKLLFHTHQYKNNKQQIERKKSGKNGPRGKVNGTKQIKIPKKLLSIFFDMNYFIFKKYLNNK